MFRATVSLALALIPFRIAAQDASSLQCPPRLAPQPGDVAQTAIWREEDLSGEFPMDESGVVVLPLLGGRRVVDIPFKELRNPLLTDYLTEPRNWSIVITPLRRVFVLGEVNSPGLQFVDRTISLAGAIALAGVASNEGDLTRIAVVRDRQAAFYTVPATSALAAFDTRSGDQIFVGRRSWLDPNSTFLVSTLLSVTTIVISLIR